VGGGGLGVVDGLDKVVVVEVVDVVVEVVDVDVVVEVVDVDVVVKVVDVVVQVVDVVEEANVVDFGCFFDLFFFSLFFFFFVVVVVDVKVLLLCHHFFFLPVLLDLENKLEQRWQGKALAYSHRERKRREKKICFGKKNHGGGTWRTWSWSTSSSWSTWSWSSSTSKYCCCVTQLAHFLPALPSGE
jgi:hypothetical protein